MSDLVSAIEVSAWESALVRDLKLGSEEAFAQLIGRYSQPIYSMVLRSLRDPADAADVTQDVFIKVFRHIRTFNGSSSLRTWIYRIALHEVSNQQRWWCRHKRQETALDAPTGTAEDEAPCLRDLLPSHEASPLEACCTRQTGERVAAALQSVPEPFRQVVVLREIEGFGYEEIAEMLGIQIGTVKSRLTRGRAALRAALVLNTPAIPTGRTAHETTSEVRR